jgi:hypothetical protein
MSNKITTVITSILKYRIIVTKESVDHALKHFILPEDIFLELLERILKDPTEVFEETHSEEKSYHLFYKISQKKYILAIVKKATDGYFFTSMYSTGSKIKSKHKNLKRIKL